MKRNHQISTFFLSVLMGMSITVHAQNDSLKNPSGKLSSNYDVNEVDGKERIKVSQGGKAYQFELLNNKITSLTIDGNRIPTSQWSNYDSVIDQIRKELRSDIIQANKNQEQAKLSQQNAIQARAHALNNRRSATVNQGNASIDEQSAKINQQHALKNQTQAALNQKKALLNRENAKKRQIQAIEDQQLMKDMADDLTEDHIIVNRKDLKQFKLNPTEMIINGKKQPDSLLIKYKTKYSKIFDRSISKDVK